MASKYVLDKAKDGQFKFTLKAANGEVILTSELYKQKASALNGIESVRKNSPKDENYEKKVSSDDRYYFNLKAANRQVIGTSQMYKSASGRDGGIESVKKNGPDAKVDDQTGQS